MMAAAVIMTEATVEAGHMMIGIVMEVVVVGKEVIVCDASVGLAQW